MSDERTGRELTPHDGTQPPAPVPTPEQISVERFSAGARSHAVGLTEERAAQVVRQSGNARNVAFLAILLVAIFIPVYWFYALGVPALGISGQMQTTAHDQMVTDVQRGYALFLANCARCHGDNGQGGVGPPLNDQAKLYNAINQNGGSGTGHLNPKYINQVLAVGGRYVCGDANSVMPAWLQPNGPLNYREVEELVAWITASDTVTFMHDPHSGHAVGVDPKATPYLVHGWTDPNYEPAPGAPTPPACWRNPSGQVGGGTGAANASLAPITNPGTVDAPRVIKLEETGSLTITDPDGTKASAIAVKAGETVQFEVTNTAGFAHNFFIGPNAILSKASGDIPETAGVVGIPQFTEGTQSVTWTVPAAETKDLVFGCTLPGHFTTMNGIFTIQP